MTRVPWFLLWGIVSLLVAVFVMPQVPGFDTRGTSTLSIPRGQQAILFGAAVGGLLVELVIRGYQLFLARALANVVASLDGGSMAILVLPENESTQLPPDSIAQGTKVVRVWPKGYPRIIVFSSTNVRIRSAFEDLASFSPANIEHVRTVEKPGRKHLGITLTFGQGAHVESNSAEMLEFSWFDARSGLRPVSQRDRIEEMCASIRNVVHGGHQKVK